MNMSAFMSILWVFLLSLLLRQAYRFYFLHLQIKRMEESFKRSEEQQKKSPLD
jgi:hypothetical protein